MVLSTITINIHPCKLKPNGGIHCSKGSPTRDPLTPFFVVAEGLSGLIRVVEPKSLIQGVKIGDRCVKVSLLQFVDDNIFFLKDDMNESFSLKAALRSFEIASGLKVNIQESSVTGIHVEQRKVSCIAKELNCNIMDIPFIYLGLLVGEDARKMSMWQPMINVSYLCSQ